jgi:hypothetical protein
MLPVVMIKFARIWLYIRQRAQVSISHFHTHREIRATLAKFFVMVNNISITRNLRAALPRLRDLLSCDREWFHAYRADIGPSYLRVDAICI